MLGVSREPTELEQSFISEGQLLFPQLDIVNQSVMTFSKGQGKRRQFKAELRRDPRVLNVPDGIGIQLYILAASYGFSSGNN